MKPNRIILVRHGESIANVDKSYHGKIPDYTMHLTPTGKLQAEQAGREIRNMIGDQSAFFYVSPYWRTRETFEGINRSMDRQLIKLREEPRLREQEWGHLRNIKQGQMVNDARDGFGTFYYRIPDGESAADVYDRVSDFFGSLHRDFEKPDFPENAIIVTHGMTIRLFLMRWFHWTVEEFEKVANPHNCAIIILERNDKNKYELKVEMKTHDVAHSWQRPLVLE